MVLESRVLFLEAFSCSPQGLGVGLKVTMASLCSTGNIVRTNLSLIHTVISFLESYRHVRRKYYIPERKS